LCGVQHNRMVRVAEKVIVKMIHTETQTDVFMRQCVLTYNFPYVQNKFEIMLTLWAGMCVMSISSGSSDTSDILNTYLEK
jgi:hypothetical protein